MKLFVQTSEDEPMSMSEISVDHLNLVVETGNFRYRITEGSDGVIAVREVTSGAIVVSPSSANCIEIGARI